jgi:hypothetical protein
MTVIQVQNNQRMNVTPIVWGTTPDLHSNPERGSGGGTPDALIISWWDYGNARTKTHDH